ncbi:MAG: hypothetical protein ACK4V4_05695 [Sphingobacteriales bacterium]|jgi:GLPGLI family protein
MVRISLILFFLFSVRIAQAQKLLSEGSIHYDISVQTGSELPKLADNFDGATASVYIKGSQSRSDVITVLGTAITFFDSRTGNGVVLREFGSQKLLIRMNRQNWIEKNKRYSGMKITRTSEKKVIAGYNCTKAIVELADGTNFSVFFTEEVLMENKEYDAQFREVPGTPLEFESTVGKLKVKYSASKISFDPVPIQKFEIPRSGYREMTFDETIKAVNQ